MSPVKAKEIGTGGKVVVVVLVVVEGDVLVVVTASRVEIGVVLTVPLELLLSVGTTPWSRSEGGRSTTGGKATGSEIVEDSAFEQATRVRHIKTAEIRPRI